MIGTSLGSSRDRLSGAVQLLSASRAKPYGKRRKRAGKEEEEEDKTSPAPKAGKPSSVPVHI
jgi:hypothetical protein